ncbi:vacuolar protein sorting-associated protein 35 domain-containing protein [Ditylenchus destructor]|uniref:Vacuolar protein sorting-associated protein 35 n=1 Tax=Ditylenchus destructor TaxID=166010 RepID=A0AAD4MN38_9BILA|nr:vacuolar protein sorting-associated protein 35 domain-containing protein [Ditylenchus destructor]
MRIISNEQTMLESEQEQLLNAALKMVKDESFQMKRSLDRSELMEGLKHAAAMLSELRTAVLSPKFYYRLYVDVTNEMQQHLLSYLCDNFLGEGVAELYETVQYTGNIIPRLYLLITVGVVYIKSGECPAADILRDLVEMCRGVQHPLRGLFLRNYLLTSTKELIPDIKETSVTEAPGNVAIEFIMTNFSEMNKLWVRMQHQGPSREREKRERERRELRILVGTNLVRLSQLESLDLETYRRMVLPGILEQSVSCREPISQEYLMECVIQVFPDNYHLSTLHEFLDACADLHEQVHIKNILGTLIDHLAQFAIAEDSPGIPADLQLFDIFSQHAEQVIVSRTGVMPAEDVISIQIALLNLALTCYPDRPEFANCVFATTATLFKKMEISSVTFNSVIGRELVKLLKIPLDHYKNVINLLRLENYGDVLAAFDYKGRTHVASAIINSMIEHETVVEEEEHVEKIFSIITSLLVDQADQPKDSSLDAMALEDFEEEQNLVAKLVHLIYNEDLETHFKLLNKIRKSFGLGGMARLRHTLPATIFSTYKLLLRYHDAKSELTDFDTRVGKLFHFCMDTINALRMQAEMPEIALRFYLQSALVSDRITFDKSSSVTYEFVSKAFAIYEEDISESREQVQSLTLLLATIQRICQLPEESHEPLRNQCALYASKLIKRPDQARMVCLVARVFWFSKVSNSEEPLKDGQRVVECLRKAIKIASQCMEDLVQITLYVHILSTYVHFFEIGCDKISPETINQMIDKIRDSLLQLDPSPEADQLNEIFTALINRLRENQQNPPAESQVSYAGFVL